MHIICTHRAIYKIRVWGNRNVKLLINHIPVSAKVPSLTIPKHGAGGPHLTSITCSVAHRSHRTRGLDIITSISYQGKNTIKGNPPEYIRPQWPIWSPLTWELPSVRMQTPVEILPVTVSTELFLLQTSQNSSRTQIKRSIITAGRNKTEENTSHSVPPVFIGRSLRFAWLKVLYFKYTWRLWHRTGMKGTINRTSY